ncbi:MAG: pyrroloquinoline quinone biosynthesis peptide chaperone PqqD [Bradymonadaceae bacterium]|nr:pyrroloquinoline quinone biosynthesis peptide chaperone PqqD [Lujinxingiaceae bacterium]
MRERLLVDESSVLHLPRYVRLGFDQLRACWLVLAPERMYVPDKIALEILKRLDGVRRIELIVDTLAKEHAAERKTIATDVLKLLQELADKGLVST